MSNTSAASPSWLAEAILPSPDKIEGSKTGMKEINQLVGTSAGKLKHGPC